MSVGVSIEFKESVRTRIDIVGLIGETLALSPRRGGQEYVALCPFHDDHNPSFHVYPDRQSYRCWVCDEGGDCFSWVMKTEHVEFREALEMLAERAGIELPKTYKSQSGSSQAKTDLFGILSWAEREFHNCLLASREAQQARQYLEQERKLKPETIKTFRLGYHPRNWQWLMDRARGSFTPEQLFAARLVRDRKDRPGYRDDFVDRVLFPIHDIRGRTVAFGARVLPGESGVSGPKYLNSPESVLFAKSKLLFGLDVARPSVRESGTVIVAEGYTDCIVAHQYGITNAVGTLGTALTEQHVMELKRWAKRVVLVYDGDQAGQAAAERALAKFLAFDVDLRLLTLPDGADPADFLSAHGADAFRRLADEAVDALEYKLRVEIDRFGLETVNARRQVMEHMLELLCEGTRLAGTGHEDAILGQLARRLIVPEQNIRRHLAKMRTARSKPHSFAGSVSVQNEPGKAPPRVFSAEKLSGDEKLECELLEMIFTVPEVSHRICHEVDSSDFQNPVLRELFEVCQNLAEQDLQPSASHVLTSVEDPELKKTAIWIDAQATQKDVPGLLRRSAGNAVPIEDGSLLREVLERVRWRRERQSHERTQGQMAARSGVQTGLDADAKAILRQAADYHQKRASKKSFL